MLPALCENSLDLSISDSEIPKPAHKIWTLCVEMVSLKMPGILWGLENTGCWVSVIPESQPNVTRTKNTHTYCGTNQGGCKRVLLSLQLWPGADTEVVPKWPMMILRPWELSYWGFPLLLFPLVVSGLAVVRGKGGERDRWTTRASFLKLLSHCPSDAAEELPVQAQPPPPNTLVSPWQSARGPPFNTCLRQAGHRKWLSHTLNCGTRTPITS